MKRLLILLFLAAAAAAPLLAQESVDLSRETPGVKEIQITNIGLAFDLKEIKVRVGDTLRITYTNGGGFHDLIIDEFNVGTQRLRKNMSETIEFKVTKAGKYEYYCSVGNHRAMGMWGTLIAVE